MFGLAQIPLRCIIWAGDVKFPHSTAAWAVTCTS